MNFGFMQPNKQASLLRLHKSKQKKSTGPNRTNIGAFNAISGKNFLNTFRKSTSKDKPNFKYKTSKNSPNSSLKRIEVPEEIKKLSN